MCLAPAGTIERTLNGAGKTKLMRNNNRNQSAGVWYGLITETLWKCGEAGQEAGVKFE